MINVLYFTGSFFMLEIYDRVLPSRSVSTLVGLSFSPAACSPRKGFSIFRARVLVRIGT